MVIGLEVHCELRTDDQAVLRVPQRLRRRAQHQHLPGLPRPARLAARCSTERRSSSPCAIGTGAALRDPAVDLPPEELLLSGHAEGLPDQPVRRADQRRRLARAARRRAGSASSGPTWRRTPARPPTSAAAAASTAPTTRWSTTTGPACRWSRSSAGPTCAAPAEARAYVDELRAILVATGASDGKMEEGSLRVDANVSVRPVGRPEFGTRCEIKNLNSLRSPGPGHRLRGGPPDRAARGGRPGRSRRPGTGTRTTGRTRSMRSKEEAYDYRYFPEPDLVPLAPGPEWLAAVRAALPPMPAERRARVAGASRAGGRRRRGGDRGPPRPRQLGHGRRRRRRRRRPGRQPAGQRGGGRGRPLPASRPRRLLPAAADGGQGRADQRPRPATCSSTADARAATPTPSPPELGFEAMAGDALAAAVDEVIAAHPGEWDRFAAGEDKLAGLLHRQGQGGHRGQGRPQGGGRPVAPAPAAKAAARAAPVARPGQAGSRRRRAAAEQAGITPARRRTTLRVGWAGHGQLR